MYFKVRGALTWFTSSDDMKTYYYLACQTCKKKVTDENSAYKCENCQKSYSEAVPTFKFKFRFTDMTNHLFVNCLGECGDQIMGISAADFFQQSLANADSLKMLLR